MFTPQKRGFSYEKSQKNNINLLFILYVAVSKHHIHLGMFTVYGGLKCRITGLITVLKAHILVKN